MQPRPTSYQRCQGFTLLEVLVAMSIFAVLATAILSMMSYVLVQDRGMTETQMVGQALRSRIEIMRAVNFDSVWSAYQSGGDPGDTFTIDGIEAPSAGGPQGSVSFVGETEVTAHWGLSVDLNGDGLTTSPAPATAQEAMTWKLLPIRVEATWGARGGDRSFKIWAVLSDLDA